jgi:hypothetical protein
LRKTAELSPRWSETAWWRNQGIRLVRFEVILRLGTTRLFAFICVSTTNACPTAAELGLERLKPWRVEWHAGTRAGT